VVTSGGFPLGWTPVGAKQTVNGYEVAWSVPGANEYEVWDTDSNGGYTSTATGILSGASTELEGVEANFGETFAGAGTPATPIPIGANGELAQVGNLFELNPSGGGPLLELNGSVVTSGQFPLGWTPVGAVQTATGYEVAWSAPGGLYTLWDTDAAGNFVSDPIGVGSGSSLTLEDLEPSFQQDLNGDGRLSTQLITAPTGPGDTVDLTGQTQATDNKPRRERYGPCEQGSECALLDHCRRARRHHTRFRP
jgi:serralysin